MEIYQLKTFVEVTKTQNLTEASKNLNTSQPAASAHIKALENELGIILFSRTSKGMQLTSNGSKLLNKAKDILEALSSFEIEAELLKNNKKYSTKMGLNTNGDVLKIKELTEYVHSLSQDLELHFMQTLSENITKDLINSNIKMGFFYGNCVNTSIEYLRLKTFKMVVVYPNTLDCSVSKLSLRDFEAFSWIWTTKGCPFYSESIDYFNKQNFFPKKIMYIDDETLVGDMVQSGVGCSVLAEPIAEMFEKRNILKIWRGIDLEINLNFGYLKNHKDDFDVISIKNFVKKLWSNT